MITPRRASVIAHGDLPYHDPLDVATVEAMLDNVSLDAADRALDVGCGRGELLVRMAERFGSGGLGIDLSDELVATARRQAEARAPGVALAFEVRDASELVAIEQGYAFAACIGASHALDGFEPTLLRLTDLVRPGGWVAVGEGYWSQPPSAGLLEVLGATVDELTDYPQTLAVGERLGLELVWATHATARQWESYEQAYAANADRYAAAHSDKEGVELVRERSAMARRRRALAAVEGEGLGFALMLWQRPD